MEGFLCIWTRKRTVSFRIVLRFAWAFPFAKCAHTPYMQIRFQPNLLFAYRTEIKISWIKLFTLQFEWFFLCPSPGFVCVMKCECNLCLPSNSFVLFTSNNWIMTILITQNTFSKNLIQIFSFKNWIRVCAR